MKRREYDEVDVLVAVCNSLNYTDVLKQLGLPLNGGNRRTIKRFVEKRKMDISHFKRIPWNKS